MCFYDRVCQNVITADGISAAESLPADDDEDEQEGHLAGDEEQNEQVEEALHAARVVHAHVEVLALVWSTQGYYNTVAILHGLMNGLHSSFNAIAWQTMAAASSTAAKMATSKRMMAPTLEALRMTMNATRAVAMATTPLQAPERITCQMPAS